MPIFINALDGYPLAAQLYPATKTFKKKKTLIINSATAVDKKLYHHYALFMASNGYDVITYDYRGIAGSRPKKLRGFEASFTKWGKKDFPGILNYVQEQFPNQTIDVLGHSIGGTIIGMTPQCNIIRRIINIGAQAAYYKDWEKSQRRKIYFLWHFVLPAITKVIGYFPGKKLNMLEDVPKGVIRQWHGRRLEESYTKQLTDHGYQIYYDHCIAPILTLGIEDDPIGTAVAIRRIHDLFINADKQFRIIPVTAVPTKEIGHFGFFSRKFKDHLWPITLDWFTED